MHFGKFILGCIYPVNDRALESGLEQWDSSLKVAMPCWLQGGKENIWHVCLYWMGHWVGSVEKSFNCRECWWDCTWKFWSPYGRMWLRWTRVQKWFTCMLQEVDDLSCKERLDRWGCFLEAKDHLNSCTLWQPFLSPNFNVGVQLCLHPYHNLINCWRFTSMHRVHSLQPAGLLIWPASW